MIIREDTLADLGPSMQTQRTIPQFAHNYIMLTLATFSNALDAADRKTGDPQDSNKYGFINVMDARDWLRSDGWARLSDVSMFIDIPNECQYKAWLAEREMIWLDVDGGMVA